MPSLLDDIGSGVFAAGVNHSTYAVLNIACLLVVLALLLLLGASIASNPSLVPHVAVLLVLACGLWGSILWFISNVGLVSVEDQQRQLEEEEKRGAAAAQGGAAAAGIQPSGAHAGSSEIEPASPSASKKQQ